MKLVFSVELETETNNAIEPFWMYYGYGYNKEKALEVAGILSNFIPFCEYPTKIIVYQEEEIKEGNLINKKAISTELLKDEDGFSLIKVFSNKEAALEYWLNNYYSYLYDIEELSTDKYILKIREYEKYGY